jgi:hypothetical protein
MPCPYTGLNDAKVSPTTARRAGKRSSASKWRHLSSGWRYGTTSPTSSLPDGLLEDRRQLTAPDGELVGRTVLDAAEAGEQTAHCWSSIALTAAPEMSFG